MERVTQEAGPRPVWWGPAALAVAALCWGLSVPLSKRAVDTLPPANLLTLQLLVSLAVLWPVVLVSRKAGTSIGVTRGSFLRACLSGALQPGLTYLLVTLGLLFTTASKVVLLDATEPIMIMALAALLLGERLTRLQIGLAAVTLLGTVLVILPQIDLAAPSWRTFIGDLLVLAGIGLASLYVVISRRLIASNDGLALAALQQSAAFCVAVVALLVALTLGQTSSGLDRLDWELGLIVVASGLLQFALPFSLYLVALRHTSAAVSALYLPLIPVSGLLTAHILLGETLVGGQWAGAALIIVSVLGISWRTLRRP